MDFFTQFETKHQTKTTFDSQYSTAGTIFGAKTESPFVWVHLQHEAEITI